MTEPIVTTPDFTPPEQAAWRVAIDRGLPIEAADLRAMLNAAAPLIAAAQLEADRQLAITHNATYLHIAAAGGIIQPVTSHPFADLLTDTEGGHADGT